MTRPMRLLALVALAGIVSLVAAFGGVAGAVDNKGAKVKVGDDFFDPTSVTIAKGAKVTFKWIGTDKHNVTKKKGPGKSFASETTSQTGFKYTHKFKKAGTYKIICTVHDGMKTKVKVN
jgi:plastocyanin